MTLKTFLEELSKTPREWQFCGIGRMIRFGDTPGVCPLIYLAGRNCLTSEAIDKLKMNQTTGWKIASSADWLDYSPSRYDPKLRAKLLEACSLKEGG